MQDPAPPFPFSPASEKYGLFGQLGCVRTHRSCYLFSSIPARKVSLGMVELSKRASLRHDHSIGPATILLKALLTSLEDNLVSLVLFCSIPAELASFTNGAVAVGKHGSTIITS